MQSATKGAAEKRRIAVSTRQYMVEDTCLGMKMSFLRVHDASPRRAGDESGVPGTYAWVSGYALVPSGRVTLRGCEEIETIGCRRQPLTPTLSRRERAIERRNFHASLPLTEEPALTIPPAPSPPPPAT